MSHYGQIIKDHGANAEALELVCGEVEQMRTDLERVTRERDDARMIVKNLDAEAAMNRDLQAKEVDRLRTDLERVTRELRAEHDGRTRIQGLLNHLDLGNNLEGHIEDVDALIDYAKKQDATIARLTADLAEARKDGERLDWLEATGNRMHGWTVDWTKSGPVCLVLRQDMHSMKHTARMALDAARDAGKGAKR